MKKYLIAALVCTNAILLVTLLFGVGMNPAQAQLKKGPVVINPGPAYMSCTARVNDYRDAIIIMDLRTRRLAGIEIDTSGGKMSLKELKGPNIRK